VLSPVFPSANPSAVLRSPHALRCSHLQAHKHTHSFQLKDFSTAPRMSQLKRNTRWPVMCTAGSSYPLLSLACSDQSEEMIAGGSPICLAHQMQYGNSPSFLARRIRTHSGEHCIASCRIINVTRSFNADVHISAWDPVDPSASPRNPRAVACRRRWWRLLGSIHHQNHATSSPAKHNRNPRFGSLPKLCTLLCNDE